MIDTKHERFKRVASARTAKLLDMITLLGNCANTNHYAYSDNEVEKIFTTLENSLNDTKALFFKQNIKSKKFSL